MYKYLKVDDIQELVDMLKKLKIDKDDIVTIQLTSEKRYEVVYYEQKIEI